MGESKERQKKQRKRKQAPPSAIEDETYEDDLDGIGAVFSSKSSGSASSAAAAEAGDDPTTAVPSSRMSSSSFTPLDPSQWAYDSGKVIERGAVILGGVEQEFGFGLRQQYFHKAAILVLDHDEARFTKGIILNRPSDKYLEDDMNPGVRWRVWFGGDVQGLDSVIPDIVCLHSLKNDAVVGVSIPVMKDIQWTTFENAKKLVKMGVAKPGDFWLFAGYAGWGSGQLMSELDRRSWHMVAADSRTLLKELARQTAGSDPRDAGLDTWDLLMRMIGRGDAAEESAGDFDDLMLKEWARGRLADGGGGGAGAASPPPAAAAPGGTVGSGPVGGTFGRAAGGGGATPPRAGAVPPVGGGALVRASPSGRSPFLLSRQEYHKSVVLVVSDDESLTVGAMLNHPAAKGLEMEVTDRTSRDRRAVTVPLRYGGEYAVKGRSPLLWLHRSPRLRASGVGSGFGGERSDGGGIWKCSQEEATSAIGRGAASPDDFIVVSGVSVWTKGGDGPARGGMPGEVAAGRFEVVPPSRVGDVWDRLRRQEVLTKLNIVKNLAVGDEAWNAGGDGREGKNGGGAGAVPVTGGIGEGYDEEDDGYVHNSDTKVSDLSDAALRSWVATFLLGAPSLGG